MQLRGTRRTYRAPFPGPEEIARLKQDHIFPKSRYGAHSSQEVCKGIPLAAAQVAGLFRERDQGSHGSGRDPTALRGFPEDAPRGTCPGPDPVFSRTAGDTGRLPTRVATVRVGTRVRSAHFCSYPFNCRLIFMPVLDRQFEGPIKNAIQYLGGHVRKASDLVPDPDAKYRPPHDGLHRASPVMHSGAEPSLGNRSGQHGVGTDTGPLGDLNKRIFREFFEKLPAPGVLPLPCREPVPATTASEMCSLRHRGTFRGRRGIASALCPVPALPR